LDAAGSVMVREFAGRADPPLEDSGWSDFTWEPIMNRALWIIQGLLAIVFVFAGVAKLLMPVDVLARQTQLPGLFLRFISVAEVLGAIGLILPGLLRIAPGLTPLAAACLVIIMIGATVLTLKTAGIALALMPLVVGLLSAFVAYGRWRFVDHSV
jgi:hypothetical protein